MILTYVPPDKVPGIWSEVCPFLDIALKESDCRDYGVLDLKRMLWRGDHDLIIAMDGDDVVGAATVFFENTPMRRVAVVTAIGGRLITTRETWESFSKYLKFKGATTVRGFARESVARLWRRYGFEERSRVVEVSL